MPRHDGMGRKGGPPAPRLVLQSSSFDHPKSDIPGYVGSHPFNQAMELFLPFPAGTASRQVTITNMDALGTPQPVFQRVRTPLSTFVSPDFLATYMRGGAEFLAVSTGTPIDRTDVAAVSPDGKLYLALVKESYERLGLVGTTSAFQPKQRHNVTIDLCAKSFVPGRKLHDRVQECLTERAGSLDFLCLCLKDGKPLEIPFPGAVKHALERTDRIIEGLRLPILQKELKDRQSTAEPMDWGLSGAASWEEPAENARAESDSKGNQQQTKVEWMPLEEPAESAGPRRKPQQRTLKLSRREQRSDRQEGDPLLQEKNLLALFDWLGAVACGVAGREVQTALTAAPDDQEAATLDLDWFEGSGLATKDGSGQTVRWTGLIAPSQVLSCIAFARKLLEENRVPWVALTVWGVADSPVSWGGAEHGFAQSGENDYSLIMMKDGRYLLFSAACGYDAMRLG